jgi:hypothetical protein
VEVLHQRDCCAQQSRASANAADKQDKRVKGVLASELARLLTKLRLFSEEFLTLCDEPGDLDLEAFGGQDRAYRSFSASRS